MERRLAALAQDIETAEAHQNDLLIINGRTCQQDEVQKLLAQRLKTVPASVIAPHHIPLRMYHGLDFGMIPSTYEPPEIYIEVATTRRVRLSRDHQGPGLS